MKAIVLGAREGVLNIGTAIGETLEMLGWETYRDDCAVGDGSRPPGGNLPNDEVAREHGYNVTDKGRYQRFEVPPSQTFERENADALVVSLGATYKGDWAEIPEWEISRIINANLVLPLKAARRYVAAAEQARAAAPLLDGPRRPRHIVFIGSYAHRHPFTNGTLYCAAKAGIDMAARTLGWELTARGYRIHVVHPFHVQGTPMWAEVEQGVMESKGMTYEEADAYNRKDLLMPDLLTPEEVANVVGWLLNNPAAQWTSGTAIELFGGSR